MRGLKGGVTTYLQPKLPLRDQELKFHKITAKLFDLPNV